MLNLIIYMIPKHSIYGYIYGIFISRSKKLSQGYIYIFKKRPIHTQHRPPPKKKQIGQTLRLLALWIIQDRLATLFGGLSRCIVYMLP